MGRNVKIRTSYYHDLQYMMRLKKAVEEDNTRPSAWRSEVMSSLQQLIESLVQAPEPTKAA